MTPIDMYYTVASVFLTVLLIGLIVMGFQVYRLLQLFIRLAERAHSASDRFYVNILSSEAGLLTFVTSVFRALTGRKGGERK